MPSYYIKITNATQKEGKLKETITFYECFRKFLSENEAHSSNLCPILSYVIAYGNDRVDLMKRRNNGENISDDEDNFVMVDDDIENVKIPPTIQWDIDTENDEIIMGTPADIQWDIDEDLPMGDPVEISWDIGVDDAEEAKEIPWEIEVEDGGIDKIENPIQLTPENSKESIIENSDTRKQFLDEILEVCFCFFFFRAVRP